MIQLVQGMQDIKLNNCERQKRWERIQVKLFKIGLKGLCIGQIQQPGSVFFTQTTHILIYYIAAKSVVEGSMTLGMMMSLTYIIGQVSAPIGEFYGILSIFLLEFIIPKFQQKRRDLFSIDIHTIYGRRNKTAKKDSMTMAVLQSRCLSGVRMKDNSRERRNHVAAMIERSLESHLSVMESYRRKTRLRVLSMRTRRKRKIQSLPCSPPCGRQSRQTLSMLLPLSMSGQKHDEKSIFRAIHCQLDVDCYSSASVSDQ